MKRRLSAVLAIAMALSVIVAPASAARPFPNRIDLPNGWAPEGITAGTGTTVYVGSLATGSVLKADVRTGMWSPLVPPAGGPAVGVEYEAGANRLWVAGGPTGQVRVYDASSGTPLETYTFSPAGFLNDLVVTDSAVYVTDSRFAHLNVIPLGEGGELPDPSEVTTLPLGGDFELVAGQFNANGIVAARGWLIVVNSFTGKLFRVDPATGDALEIRLGAGVDVRFGDGLEVHGGTLYVVQNQLNRVAVFALGPRLVVALRLGFLSSNSLAVPTTAAWAAGSVYAVNARFGTPVTPDTQYWITRLPSRP